MLLTLNGVVYFCYDYQFLECISKQHQKWVGVGGFSKVVATFNHVGGSFNQFMATTRDVWIIPSFQILD